MDAGIRIFVSSCIFPRKLLQILLQQDKGPNQDREIWNLGNRKPHYPWDMKGIPRIKVKGNSRYKYIRTSMWLVQIDKDRGIQKGIAKEKVSYMLLNEEKSSRFVYTSIPTNMWVAL